MRIAFGTAALAAVLALASAAPADDTTTAPASKEAATWEADFDVAVARAKKEKKDLLVDFTGSDWCGWCIKLHKEVFDHDEFLAAATKDYVLVALDYPRDEAVKAKVPNPARNAELSQKYSIGGFPTILLMNVDGDVFGKTGYQPGGPGKYVEHIGKLRTEGLPELKTARELTALVRSAQGADLAAACDKAIASFTSIPEGSGLGVVRVLPVRAAFEVDAGNKAGIAAKAGAALMKAGFADGKILEACGGFDPKNEKGLLEQVVLAKARTLRSIEDVKVHVKECDDLFALGTPKDPMTAKLIAQNAMGLNHQYVKDAAKAREWAKRRVEMGFTPEEARVEELAKKILAEEAPK